MKKYFILFLIMYLQNIGIIFSQWQKVYVSGYVVNCFATNGTDVFAGLAGGGVIKSSDSGVTWSAINTGLPSTIIKAMAVNGSTIFVGTAINGVYKSIDNGISWTASNNGFIGLNSNKIRTLNADGGNLYAGTDGAGIFMSSNNGSSWSAINNGISPYNKIISFSANGTKLFVGIPTTSSQGLIRSIDTGGSWNMVNIGVFGSYSMTAVASFGSNLICCIDGVFNNIWLSSNNGNSFFQIGSNTIPQGYVVYSLAVTGSNIFAGVESGTSSNNGVYLSTDNGYSFTNITTGQLGLSGVYSLIIVGNDIYAGTNSNGIWKRPLTQIITSVNEEKISFTNDSYVFPNPFNDKTTLYFADELYNAVLKVFCSNGNEVLNIPFSGKNITVEKNNLVKGIYFYKVISNENSIRSGKLIIE